MPRTPTAFCKRREKRGLAPKPHHLLKKVDENFIVWILKFAPSLASKPGFCASPAFVKGGRNLYCFDIVLSTASKFKKNTCILSIYSIYCLYMNDYRLVAAPDTVHKRRNGVMV